MKQTDDTLRNLFSSKLGECELDVSPEIWQNISSQLPGASGAAVGISGAVKFAIAAIISGAIALGGYMILQKDSEEGSAVVADQQTENNARVENSLETSVSEETTTSNIKPIESGSTKIIPSSSSQNGLKSVEIEEPPLVENQISYVSTPDAQTSSDQQPASISQQAGPVNQPQTDKENIQEISNAFSVVSVDKTERRYFFMPQYTDATGYFWDFGDGETSVEKSPAHSYSEDGTYTVSLKITDEGVSEKAMEQEVSAYQTGLIFIPNIFTPDGDGLNDELDVLEKSSGVQIHRILIFDLNGNKVFESDGSRMWDGNSAGSQPCPAGTYRCVVSGTDRNQDLIEKRMNVYLSR